MSVDHAPMNITQLYPVERPVFLGVKAGDIVIVWDDPSLKNTDSTDWFMGQVLFAEGSARDPKAPSLFQIGDVDTGEVTWVNADCVQKVLMPGQK